MSLVICCLCLFGQRLVLAVLVASHGITGLEPSQASYLLELSLTELQGALLGLSLRLLLIGGACSRPGVCPSPLLGCRIGVCGVFHLPLGRWGHLGAVLPLLGLPTPCHAYGASFGLLPRILWRAPVSRRACWVGHMVPASFELVSLGGGWLVCGRNCSCPENSQVCVGGEVSEEECKGVLC